MSAPPAPAQSSAPGAQLAPGDLIELDVTGIAHGGVCVARHDGRVVFVADAIPGEHVLARITEARKKSFARAATVEAVSYTHLDVYKRQGRCRDRLRSLPRSPDGR